MWTKKDALEAAARGEGCLGKARDDEPVFILVGDDANMPGVIRDWANRVEEHAEVVGQTVPGKVFEARRFANEVEQWQNANPDNVKNPD